MYHKILKVKVVPSSNGAFHSLAESQELLSLQFLRWRNDYQNVEFYKEEKERNV